MAACRPDWHGHRDGVVSRCRNDADNAALRGGIRANLPSMRKHGFPAGRRTFIAGFMVGSSASPSGASRHLLRSLRELMEQSLDTQSRLDRIVVQISRAMVADVCSVYLRRTDGVMELYATEGLARDAVHRTRMKPGEGLVGLVAEEAEPVALSDASSHPRFSYRPETGEDPYQTFLGVPLLRSGRVIGVLTVQNMRARTYPDDDIEALRMIAAFFAEQLPDQDSSAALAGFDIRPTGPESVSGKRFSGGLARGPALLHDPAVEPTRLLADDPEVEESRLSEALGELRRGLERLLTGDIQSLGGEPYEVLETFHLLSMDTSWERRLVDGVRAGLTAEAAVEQVRSEHRAKMNKARDGYLRDRLQDLEELDNRLLRHLAGAAVRDIGETEGFVLVARDIGAAELLEYGRAKIAAVVLEEGSPSAHADRNAQSLNKLGLDCDEPMTYKFDSTSKNAADVDDNRIPTAGKHDSTGRDDQRAASFVRNVDNNGFFGNDGRFKEFISMAPVETAWQLAALCPRFSKNCIYDIFHCDNRPLLHDVNKEAMASIKIICLKSYALVFCEI